MSNKLFYPLYDASNLNRNFLSALNDPGYLPAKNGLIYTFSEHPKPEKHFIEQFQTTGFDSRLWELYLIRLFLENNYVINCNHPSPDFVISKNSLNIAVEAVTSNPGSIYFEENHENIHEYTAIKLSNPLYDKLKKEYWRETHILNFPFILAVAPFHGKTAWEVSDATIISYLYGLQTSAFYNEKGELLINSTVLNAHEYQNKRKPSGFFKLPNSENISAVLFSNAGTISKFNRMEFLANKNYPIVMLHAGTCYNPEENACKPNHFCYQVGDPNVIERWDTGAHMFHNPQAKNPLDDNCFPHISHSRVIDNKIVTSISMFHPYISKTIIFQIK